MKILTSLLFVVPAVSLQAATLVVSPDQSIVTTGTDPGVLNNPTVLTTIETDFPDLVGDLIRVRNQTNNGVQSTIFTVAGTGSTPVNSVTSFVIYGLQSTLEFTAAVAEDGMTPVTFSIASSPAPSDLSLIGVTGGAAAGTVGSTIAGSANTSGVTRFAGATGNDQQGVAVINFNTAVTSFTLTDIQPGNSINDTYFVAFPVPVPEPSGVVLLGLSSIGFLLRRKR